MVQGFWNDINKTTTMYYSFGMKFLKAFISFTDRLSNAELFFHLRWQPPVLGEAEPRSANIWAPPHRRHPLLPSPHRAGSPLHSSLMSFSQCTTGLPRRTWGTWCRIINKSVNLWGPGIIKNYYIEPKLCTQISLFVWLHWKPMRNFKTVSITM